MTGLKHGILWGCVLSAVALASAETPVQQARSNLEKWVETKQLISKARSEWRADRETFEQTIQAFERELASIQEQQSKLSTNNTQVEKERAEAEALKKSSEEAAERARAFAADFESRVQRLVPQLPPPLQDILRPTLNRIPTDAKTRMSVAERMQVAVGLLSEIDKFNSSVSVFSERRKNAKSEEVAVQAVYVGLGAAYFVNDAADFAGTGTCGPTGWTWQERVELAPVIQEAVRVYRNERPAKFLALPAIIQ